jgi:hypothetical protein
MGDFPIVDLTLPNTVYLLYKWSDERSDQGVVGIFTNVEKLKASAQMHYDAEAGGDEPHTLEWKTATTYSSEPVAPFAPAGPAGTYGADYPYEIMEVTLDEISIMEHDGTKWVAKTVTV